MAEKDNTKDTNDTGKNTEPAQPATNQNNNSPSNAPQDGNTQKDGAASEDNSQSGQNFNSTALNVRLERDEPKSFTKSLADIKDSSNYLSRKKEKGLVNEQTGSAFVIRDNGQANISAGKQAQYKLNPNGEVAEISLESNTITNRKSYLLDELVINHHKLNPAVYELTDMRELEFPLGTKGLVGNFTMLGTVLVKAWDVNLQRYMLIRRLVRMPLFSNLLNVPDINTGIKVTDPLKIDEDILALSSKGYQVNAEIKDDKSLIGKEGVVRSAAEVGGGQVDEQAGTKPAGGGKAPADVIEKGIQIALQIADDPNVGYSQSERYGNPNYDCTSFISGSLDKAGLGCGFRGGDSFDSDMQQFGFALIPWSDGRMSELQRGDILSAAGHVEWYIGNGQVVGAHTSSKPFPDQVSVEGYYDDNWLNILRYNG